MLTAFSFRSRRRAWAYGLVLCGLVGCQSTNGWVMNNSGMGYYEQGNLVMARHEFAQAVTAAPWDPDYRHNLAMTMKKMGDIGGAEKILRHNLTLDAMHQPTYHSLARLMTEQGRQDEAQDLLVTWADTQPYNAESHIELAKLSRDMGNLPVAEQQLRQALQVEPHNPEVLATLGDVYQQGGQPRYAAQMYQRSLAMNFDQPDVQSRLASVQGHRGSGPVFSPRSAPTMALAAPLPPPVFSNGFPDTQMAFGGPMPAGMSSGMMMSGGSPGPGPMMVSTGPVTAMAAGGMTTTTAAYPVDASGVPLPPGISGATSGPIPDAASGSLTGALPVPTSMGSSSLATTMSTIPATLAAGNSASGGPLMVSPEEFARLPGVITSGPGAASMSATTPATAGVTMSQAVSLESLELDHTTTVGSLAHVPAIDAPGFPIATPSSQRSAAPTAGPMSGWQPAKPRSKAAAAPSPTETASLPVVDPY
jgi:Tfp pilus assembly protein PilF